MKLSWGLNLGLQVLLVSGFVLFHMLIDEPRGQTSNSVFDSSRRTASAKATGPYRGSTVHAVVTVGSRNPHEIKLAHLDRRRQQDGYVMGAGEPSKQTITSVREALSKHDPEILAKAGLDWVLLTPDYRRDGQKLAATGGSSPHGLFILSTSEPGGAKAVGSHLHHELYWRFETTIEPRLKSDWPNVRYHGNYDTSRRLFFNNPRCHVSEYAASHPIADRAEIFRAMIGYPDGLRLAVSGDKCLGEKVTIFKTNMQRFLPEILGAVEY